MAERNSETVKPNPISDWPAYHQAVEFQLKGVIQHWVINHPLEVGVSLEAFNGLSNDYQTLVCAGDYAQPIALTKQIDDGQIRFNVQFYGPVAHHQIDEFIESIRPSMVWLSDIRPLFLGGELFNTAPVIMYQAAKVNGRWVLLHANEALADFLGCTIDAFIGPYATRQLMDLVHVDDREKLSAAYDYIRTTSKQMTVQYRLLNVNGRHIPVTERLHYEFSPQKIRCNSVVWHRPIDQAESQYQFDIFKRLESITEAISLQTGHQFLAQLAQHFTTFESFDRVLLTTKTTEQWWETWIVSDQGNVQPNFHFRMPSALKTTYAIWNQVDLEGLSKADHALLFGQSSYVTLIPLMNEHEVLEGMLCMAASESIEDTETMAQIVRFFGLRILREIAQIRVSNTRTEQNELLVRQKNQLTQMVSLLGHLDTVDDEFEFLQLTQSHLEQAFTLSSMYWAYWFSGEWFWVEKVTSFTPTWFQKATLIDDPFVIELLDISRRSDELNVSRASRSTYWPVGHFEAGYVVLVLNFVNALPDLDLLQFSKNSLSLALQGLAQRANLRRQAMRDALTDLGNRTQLHHWMSVGLANTDQASLVLFDLNRFKEINDSFGHQLGDKLLRDVGPRVAMKLSNIEHYIARLGGDEFAVFFPNLNPEQASEQAQYLNRILSEAYVIDGLPFHVEASIGVANFPQHGNDGHELLRCADLAMYDAKATGRPFVEFNTDMDTATPLRIAVLSGLGAAITEGQLWVAFQPLMSTKSGRVAGFEALARWTHPVFGPLSPAEFIPIAEMGEGIRLITDFVLHQTLACLSQWRELQPDLHVAVNISPRVLLDDHFPEHIEALLAEYQLPGSALVLELTESTLLIDPKRAVEIVVALSQLNIDVEIDDFGTGYSSLAYLKRLPITALKIDRSFVSDILTSTHNEVIVNSTVQMAHNLGLQTVAEGVEDEATLLKMMKLGCDLIQGYYYSKPIPSNDVTDWLRRHL